MSLGPFLLSAENNEFHVQVEAEGGRVAELKDEGGGDKKREKGKEQGEKEKDNC